MPSIKIATVQSRVHQDIKKNGNEIRRLIIKGHSQGADLFHFTEGALSGYTKEQLGSWKHVNFDEIRHEIREIQSLCKRLGSWLVFGCAHELSNGNRPHNSMYVISDKGEIINRYDKRKCSHSELMNWYTPGFEACIFEVKGIRFGCLLCIEIQFPELFVEAEREDVHCILFSAYSKSKMFGIQAQGYAASHNYWISMSIPTNESQDLSSQFIGPNGEIQAECKRNCSSIVVSEMDTESKEWDVPLRYAKPWRKLARKGEIYDELRVNDVRSEMKNMC